MNASNTVLAFVTDDGTTISAHFGRALHYEIVRLHEGKVVARHRVAKAGHHTGGEGHHEHDGHGHGHDHHQKHAAMTAPLAGVSILVARGMGAGAEQHLRAEGIEPVLTDLRTIDEALAHYLAGTLAHNPDRLHDHGPHR